MFGATLDFVLLILMAASSPSQARFAPCAMDIHHTSITGTGVLLIDLGRRLPGEAGDGSYLSEITQTMRIIRRKADAIRVAVASFDGMKSLSAVRDEDKDMLRQVLPHIRSDVSASHLCRCIAPSSSPSIG